MIESTGAPWQASGADEQGASIGLGAPGYVITYVWACGIICGMYYQQKRRTELFKVSKGRFRVSTGSELSVQGLKMDRFGKTVKVALILFVIWLNLVMLLSTIGQYTNQWLLPPVPGTFTHESFTRAMLSAWSALAVIIIFWKLNAHTLRTFFLVPEDLGIADFAVVHETGHAPDRAVFVPIHHLVSSQSTRVLEYRLRRYLSEDGGEFRAASVWEGGSVARAKEVQRGVSGLSYEEAATRLSRFGKNQLDYKVPGFWQAVGEEFSSFFYVYQFFAVWIPTYWDYLTLSMLQVALIVSAGVLKVVTEQKRKKELAALARIDHPIQCRRSTDAWTQVWVSELVPGDVVKLENGQMIGFDGVVIDGACVCDEALLTGETMPVQKHAIPRCIQPETVLDHTKNIDHKKHLVFAGTQVVGQACVALVIRTGACTDRGKLLSSLFFGDFEAGEQRDSLERIARLNSVASSFRASPEKVAFGTQLLLRWKKAMAAQEWLAVSGLLVVLALVVVAIVLSKYPGNWSAILAALNNVTVLINPLLPVALLGGQLTSAARLKKKRIFCRDIQKLTPAGAVNCICLDKTGTITKPGLDFVGLCDSLGFRLATEETPSRGTAASEGEVEAQDTVAESATNPLLELALAACHSLSVLGEGELVGHQVELKAAAEAQRRGFVIEPEAQLTRTPTGAEFETVQVWAFSHETATMSVQLRRRDRSSEEQEGEEVIADELILMKGSFEAVARRCSAAEEELSTTRRLAESYSASGHYVIAVAAKTLSGTVGGTRMSREEAESEMELVGLFLFRNEPKSDSRAAIEELHQADVRTVMITGDHVLTGVAIAKDVGLIDKQKSVMEIVVASSSPGGALFLRQISTDRNFSLTDVFATKQHADYEFAMSGDVLRVLLSRAIYPDEFAEQLLSCTRIFGRVSPADKVAVVGYLQTALGYRVGMCGDGGNDSGALRVANGFGLALCGRAEASVAAPISTDGESLTALITVMKESRASMATSLASFRYIFVGGLLNTFGQTLLLVTVGGFFGSVAFIWVDIICIPGVLWAMAWSRPHSGPLSSLKTAECVSTTTLLSGPMLRLCLWSLVLWTGVLLTLFFVLVHFTSWYQPFSTDVPIYEWSGRGNNVETALVFLWTSVVLTVLGLTYSIGGHTRQACWRNWRLVLVSGALLALVVAVALGVDDQLSCIFKVNCSGPVYVAIQDHWINALLFKYDHVGGQVWDGVTESTVFPDSWKLGMLAFLLAASLLHHWGVHLLSLV